jgi:hypothetical protein
VAEQGGTAVQTEPSSQEVAVKVLGRKGDLELKWDTGDEASAAKAKTEFNRLRKNGYAFYVIAQDPNVPGEEVKTFDAMQGALTAEYKKATPVRQRKTTGVARPAMRGG